MHPLQGQRFDFTSYQPISFLPTHQTPLPCPNMQGLMVQLDYHINSYFYLEFKSIPKLFYSTALYPYYKHSGDTQLRYHGVANILAICYGQLKILTALKKDVQLLYQNTHTYTPYLARHSK